MSKRRRNFVNKVLVAALLAPMLFATYTATDTATSAAPVAEAARTTSGPTDTFACPAGFNTLAEFNNGPSGDISDGAFVGPNTGGVTVPVHSATSFNWTS